MTPRVVSVCVAFAVAGVVALAFGSAVSRPAERSFAKHAEPGVYVCATCRMPLFSSKDKFMSTTRWPSFRATLPGSVETRIDRSLSETRTEVLCHQCSAHLGHVFEDGDRTGDSAPDARMRYCILSKSLEFEAERGIAEGAH